MSRLASVIRKFLNKLRNKTETCHRCFRIRITYPYGWDNLCRKCIKEIEELEE